MRAMRLAPTAPSPAIGGQLHSKLGEAHNRVKRWNGGGKVVVQGTTLLHLQDYTRTLDHNPCVRNVRPTPNTQLRCRTTKCCGHQQQAAAAMQPAITYGNAAKQHANRTSRTAPMP
jgi:hypothetical protein